jgi:hypothetical protein
MREGVGAVFCMRKQGGWNSIRVRPLARNIGGLLAEGRDGRPNLRGDSLPANAQEFRLLRRGRRDMPAVSSSHHSFDLVRPPLGFPSVSASHTILDIQNTIRLSDPLDRDCKHISDTAFGLNCARRAWIAFQFAPEAQDLHINTAIEDILVYACRL